MTAREFLSFDDRQRKLAKAEGLKLKQKCSISSMLKPDDKVLVALREFIGLEPVTEAGEVFLFPDEIEFTTRKIDFKPRSLDFVDLLRRARP